MTNAISTMDPKLVTHAIGPQVERVLSPYTFVAPPTALVNGWVEVRRGKQSDLRFDLSGGLYEDAARGYDQIGHRLGVALVDYNQAYDLFLQGRFQVAGALLALGLVKPQLLLWLGAGLAVPAARQRAFLRYKEVAVERSIRP